MSSGKAKKHGKADQIPKPISIKKEKVEEDRQLHPISHYIDDRLELVKQIFGTLKPKTILNLAPEFLKKTPLDEIEELCLEELLCLSTKRLKSIIENTRCPTDTESSEDSDVEHKEEHISLEEISSDSDIGGQESRRAKKKLKSKKANNGNENKADGQMSVLELLELQARARAIRSQLAMEPITKIEVKSDDDDESPEKPVQRREKEKRSKKNTETGKRKSQEQPQAKESKKDEEVVEEAPRKKIKIKRNYRQATVSPEKEAAKSSPPTVSAPPEESTKKKSRSKSRSASLDVIPIQTETETLLISDSTDDEGTKKDQPKEAEAPVSVQPQVPEVESEPEEGEVRDEPEEIAKPEETPKPDERTQSKEPEKSEDSQKTEKSEESTKAEVKPAEEKEAPPDNSEQTALDDEDQNDDVISIGGDLEMIEEMTKDEEPPTLSNIKSEKSEKQEPEEQDNDVISLDTSEDEREKLQPNDSESWRTRYLKSSKVSQVLAASRLGKRVRDKIKKSKRSKATDCDDQEKSSKQQEVFTSKHEDGSIEQYQELLQHRQRKSSNSKADK
ncbi:neurofilament medium polypeptide isoform X1 [Drosophila ananassae]|uniref:neurofilament medium polypeptide isoform X1 n=1 Tax=Drosophila ananassae TaxID=7217 RepID=UPI0013A5EEA7|nr:neurofilament medium polypeptide isoform X1 [Drosophila ananassae]